MERIKTLCFVLPLTFCAWAMAAEPRERADIAAEFKWDLSPMYASTQAWEADVKQLEGRLAGLARYRGRLGESGATLLAALQAVEAAGLLADNVYVFAGLRSFEDMRVGENSARFSRAQGLSARFAEAVAFMRPELLQIPEATLHGMIDATPGLQVYRHYFDELLRLRDHTLSEAEEKLLAAAGDPLGRYNAVFAAFNNADVTFGEIRDAGGKAVELTKARYSAFLNSTERRVREDAWKGLFSEYDKFGNTLAATYEGHVKARVFEARVRGFDSALHAATYGSAIPTVVYTNLIKAAREGTAPLHRYLALRRKALDVPTLEIWDLYAPIIEPTFKDLPWEQARQIVADALAPLGGEYVDVYWQGFDEGWADVFETRGKRSGAYSWGTYTSRPYFSMNYNGTFDAVSTLAHEYGHSIHTYLANEAQPYVYADYRTFIAEVASMTNEAILFRKMLAEADSKAGRIFILQTWLDQFRGSFYRQVSFADFEMQAFALVESDQALTRESLNSLYRDVFAAYYGDAVNAHPLNDGEWSRIPHFYGNNVFYVYQYATSFAAATALAGKILEEGEPARQRYLAMLRAGSSDYPIALLQRAGIDMTGPGPVRDTIATFAELVGELEAALD